jgi:excisionase family DNA binding protein
MITQNFNPFYAIEQRFDKLEILLHELKTKQQTALPTTNLHERLTRKEITKEYKVSLGTIHNAMNKGNLAYSKVGRKTLFKRIDVEKWFNKKGGKKE